MEISKNTLISDIIKSNPASKDVFLSYNMGCISCMGVQNETLEKGCLMHGLDLEEVLQKLKALNS